jgi:hydantoinase/carbamoylase family amidase
VDHLQPSRTVTELKELRDLTGDERGAQRVAFTPAWAKARDWFKARLSELPVEVHTDASGNLWAGLEGRSAVEMVIGSHIDSVPNGGWLDGAFGLLAGLEVLRRLSGSGVPPVTVRLVDWADEEGARFGCSLFGSSAATGNLRPDDVRGLSDVDGVSLIEALGVQGIEFENVLQAAKELQKVAAYLELHIEQGPVLEDSGLPMAAVSGAVGLDRHLVRFTGQASHSGSTPMNKRRDAFLAAGKMAGEIYEIARRHQGVCTIGSCRTWPGIPTSVVAECEIVVDQRNADEERLVAMWTDAREAAVRFGQEGNVEVGWHSLMKTPPILFATALVDLAEQAIRETSGRSCRLTSGPLHDACQVARSGVPTAMLFVQSLGGISHNKLEDTEEEHLEMGVRALDRLADLTMHWLSQESREEGSV